MIRFTLIYKIRPTPAVLTPDQVVNAPMRKYIIIIIGTVIAVALLALFLGGGRRDAGLAGKNNPPAPQILPGEQLNIPVGDTLVLGTPRGSVTVTNFYKTADRIVGQSEAVLKETGDYIIVYSTIDSNFRIAIVAARNQRAARDAAESEFVRILGVAEKDACMLTVSVSMPYDSGGDIAGGVYPLSFCAPGVQ
jgi:hypothetical protein